MPSPSDLLLVQLAHEGKLITSEQLAEGILHLSTGTNGTTMESLLVERGWVKPADLQPLLQERERRLMTMTDAGDDKAEDALLARILVKQGLTTDREVRDCLRMQEEMTQLGKEIPRLGFLLYRNGYLRAETNLKAVLICKECASRFAAMAYDPLKTYLCKKCNGTLTRDTKNADDTLLPVSRRPMPDEVALAMKTPSSRFANGKYILIRELGRGGVGIVWKAWQTDLERFVAIKQMSSDLWGETEIKRFFREAQTAASLSHTNIATIYEVGVSDSKHWIAMEYIDGDALSAFQFRAGVGSKLGDTRYGSRQATDASGKPSEPRTRGPESRPASTSRGEPPRRTKYISLEQAVRIIRDAALAVDYAHSKGVVHRDVKPHNIMVASGGRVYVMDFGLAKPVKTKDGVTMGDTILGTPPYMSPEQARGDAVDRRTDIYSLGSVLYYVLCGKPPFSGNAPAETLMKVLTEDPEPPSKVNALCPPDLERVAMKCLEKEKHRRYPSAKAFADDLQRYRNGEPISVRPMSVAGRVAKIARQHPVLASSVLVVLVLGGGIGALWSSAVSSTREQIGKLMQQAASAQQAVPSDRVGMFENYVRVLQIDPEHKEAQAGYEKALAEMRDLSDGRKEWRRYADALHAGGNYGGAMAIYQRLLNEGSPDRSALSALIAECNARLGREREELTQLRKNDADAQRIIKGIQVRQEMHGDAMTLYLLARRLWDGARSPSGKPAEALGQAEAALTKALAKDSSFTEAVLLRGQVRRRLGNTRGAVEDFELAARQNDRNGTARFEACWTAATEVALWSRLPYEVGRDRARNAAERLATLSGKLADDTAVGHFERWMGRAMNHWVRKQREQAADALATYAQDPQGRLPAAWLTACMQADETPADAALAALKTMIDIEPMSLEAFELRALILAKGNDVDGALEAAARAVALAPDQALPLVVRGSLLARKQKNDEAVADLERAMMLDTTLKEKLRTEVDTIKHGGGW